MKETDGTLAHLTGKWFVLEIHNIMTLCPCFARLGSYCFWYVSLSVRLSIYLSQTVMSFTACQILRSLGQGQGHRGHG